MSVNEDSVANIFIVRPVIRFSFRRAQPLVIIEFLALASYGHAARNR